MNIKRKVLLKEIKSIEKGKREKGENVDFSDLYKAIKTEEERNELAMILLKHQLAFFAQKLINGGYEK